MPQATRKDNSANVLYMAIELSKKVWKLAFCSGGRRVRVVEVPAWDLAQLDEAIAAAKQRFRLDDEVPVKSCHEAGLDGFSVHRALDARGLESLVIDAASIETSRRARRPKTDRLDAKKLVRKLAQYHGGDHGVWSVVRVPSVFDEDERRLHRELERLNKERTAHRNRLQGLVATWGVRLRPNRNFLELLEVARDWNGQPLPPQLRAELQREYKRLQLVEEQIREIATQQRERVKKPQNKGDCKAADLQTIRGLGVKSAWVLSKELFGWRTFANRKEVGACGGLTPTPSQTGDSKNAEQGISKTGNRRVRSLMVELSWGWLRYQPDSELTKWFHKNFGQGKRTRRVGIVALARRLLIALWQYVEQGVVPDGAVLKA